VGEQKFTIASELIENSSTSAIMMMLGMAKGWI
jgi:hypothetical protein